MVAVRPTASVCPGIVPTAWGPVGRLHGDVRALARRQSVRVRRRHRHRRAPRRHRRQRQAAPLDARREHRGVARLRRVRQFVTVRIAEVGGRVDGGRPADRQRLRGNRPHRQGARLPASTVMSALWVAVSPSGSVAVTVTVALPADTAVNIRLAPDTETETTPSSDEAAAYVNAPRPDR